MGKFLKIGAISKTQVSQLSAYSFCFLCFFRFGLVKSYTKNYNVASDSLEPTSAKRFIAGGEDMCVRIFDSEEGKEIGE